ncbi:MAG: hypothetical protein GX298_01625 [Planctomycetes bacterium]|nr:hypothetical protein [Planctomycetota bacterium]
MMKAVMQRGVILYLIMSACCIAASTDPFPPEALPAVSIGEFLPPDFEASGLVWHTRRQKLFLVSDNGFLASMTDQGTDVELWRISADLEAVTVAFPTSDFIYLGVEHPDSIYEFNITTGGITRVFNLTPWMDGPKNSGLEALTFVPDPADPEGGLFYAGLQETGQIFVFRLPILSSAVSTAVTFVGVIYPIQGVNNISDLYYTPCQDVLYAIYDSSNLLRAMTPDGSFLRQWELPGDSQEGITLKGSELYICEDNGQNGGRVYRYAPFLVFPQPDLDNDGIVDLRDYAVFSQCWRDRLFWKTADLNKDNRLDVADIAFFASLWLRGK